MVILNYRGLGVGWRERGREPVSCREGARDAEAEFRVTDIEFKLSS